MRKTLRPRQWFLLVTAAGGLGVLSYIASCTVEDNATEDSVWRPVAATVPVATAALEPRQLEYHSLLWHGAGAQPAGTVKQERLVATPRTDGDHVTLEATLDGRALGVWDQTPGARRAAPNVAGSTAAPPSSVDSLAMYLPPAGLTVQVGEPFENAPPDAADVAANAGDGDTVTHHLHTVNKPLAIWKRGSSYLVRLETRGDNWIVYPDDDGEGIKQFDLGPAFLGYADIIYHQGRGWEVLQFVRIAQAELPDGADAGSMGVDQARQIPHAAFVACLSNRSPEAQALRGLAIEPRVAEFTSCEQP